MIRNPQTNRASEAVIRATFAPIDSVALGCAVGAWSGVVIFLATAILVAKGGLTVGPHLGLLAQYFPGYSVTWAGSLLGLGYGFLTGFSMGWLFAFTRNVIVSIYLQYIRVTSEMASVNNLLDD